MDIKMVDAWEEMPRPNQEHQKQIDPAYFSRGQRTKPASPSNPAPPPPKPSKTLAASSIPTPLSVSAPPLVSAPSTSKARTVTSATLPNHNFPKATSSYSSSRSTESLYDELFGELPELVELENDGFREEEFEADGVSVAPGRAASKERARLARLQASKQEKERQLAVLKERDTKLLVDTMLLRDQIVALLEPPPPPDQLRLTLLQAFNLVFAAEQLDALKPDSEAFALRTSTPELCEYHRQRLLHPLSLNVKLWTDLGVLEEVSRDLAHQDELNGFFDSYERIFSFASLEFFEKGMRLYEESHLADRRLPMFVRAWVQREIDAGTMDASSRIDVPYQGVCLMFSPLQRLIASKEESSRVGNFVNLISASNIPFSYTSFKLPQLSIPIDDPTSILFRRDLSELEAISVSTARHFSLNSHPGGTRIYISPDPSIYRRLYALGATQEQLNAKLPLDAPDLPAVQTKINSLKRFLDDELQYCHSQPRSKTGTMVDPRTSGGVKAKAAIVGDSTALNSRGGGFVLSMMGAKDAPEKDIKGIQTFTGDEAGRSGWLLWQTEAHGHQLDVNHSLGARVIQCFSNLWVWVCTHILVLEMTAFMSRKIELVDPIIFNTQSSKLNNISQSNRFQSSFRKDADPQQLNDFFTCSKRTVQSWFALILVTIIWIWSETLTKDWIDQIGVFYIAHTGPFDHSIRLGFSSPDGGWNAHDPRLHQLLLPIERICAALMAIARSCAADRIVTVGPPPKDRDGRIAWFKELLQEVRKTADTSGFQQELEDLKAELKIESNSICGLRTRSAYERAEEALLKKGVSKEEIAAERSKRMSEHRLSMKKGTQFVGPPIKLSLALNSFDSNKQLILSALTSHLHQPRVRQLYDALFNYYEAQQDGRSPEDGLPSIEKALVGDSHYINWFLTADEGKQLNASAAQFGKEHKLREMTDEEKVERIEGYAERALVQEEKQREKRGVKNVGELPVEDAIRKLAESSFTKAQGEGSRRDITVYKCSDCQQSFVARTQSKADHICLGVLNVETDTLDPHVDPKSGAPLPSVRKTYLDTPTPGRPSRQELLNRTLTRFRPLFVSHLLTLLELSPDDLPSLAPSVNLIELDAFSVVSKPIAKIFRPHIPLSKQVKFWTTTNTTKRDTIAAAIDALTLAAFPPPNRRRLSERDDEAWWRERGETLPTLVRHMVAEGEETLRRADCVERECEWSGYGINGLTKPSKKSLQHGCWAHPRQLAPGKKDNKGPWKRESVTLLPGHISTSFGLHVDLVRRVAYAYSVKDDALFNRFEEGEVIDFLGWTTTAVEDEKVPDKKKKGAGTGKGKARAGGGA